MVVLELEGKKFYMDGNLKKSLDYIKTLKGKDWDFVIIVDGRERSGKSVLAQQCAYYLDTTLTLDRITFTPEQFEEACRKANPHEAVIFDEAHGGLNSQSTLTEISKSIVSMLTEIGQKNLYVFIVLPNFFDLNKYVAIWRSEFLLHIYTQKGRKRGFFSVYNYDRKKKMYIMGRKTYVYCVPRNFYGHFPDGYIIDRELYKNKKAQSKYEEDVIESKSDKQDALLEFLLEAGYSYEQISEGMSKYSIRGIKSTALVMQHHRYQKRKQLQKMSLARGLNDDD